MGLKEALGWSDKVVGMIDALRSRGVRVPRAIEYLIVAAHATNSQAEVRDYVCGLLVDGPLSPPPSDSVQVEEIYDLIRTEEFKGIPLPIVMDMYEVMAGGGFAKGQGQDDGYGA